jgi:non-ribosomal peptide synthetase component E (peptide arylation enzyme)
LPAVIQRVSFRVSRREDDRFDANRFYFDGQVFVLQDVGYHSVMSRVHYVVVVVVIVVDNAAAGFNHLNIFVFEHAEINLN